MAKLDAAVRDRGLEISALALHGNPVHPDDARRKAYDLQFEARCPVAQRLGVRRFTLLAGLPGAGPGARYPNWITFPFPEELKGTGLEWEHALIPHWQVAARRAADHGVALCFEMVPGDCVFNPRAFLRLRDALMSRCGATSTRHTSSTRASTRWRRSIAWPGRSVTCTPRTHSSTMRSPGSTGCSTRHRLARLRPGGGATARSAGATASGSGGIPRRLAPGRLRRRRIHRA